MKKAVVILVLLLGSVFPLTGCTPVESAGERWRRIGLQRDMEMKMLVDDWDYFWLQERDSHLTQWHPYIGY